MNEKRTEALLAAWSDLAGSFESEEWRLVWDFRVSDSDFSISILLASAPKTITLFLRRTIRAQPPRLSPSEGPRWRQRGAYSRISTANLRFSRGLGCWGARLPALKTKEISSCRSTKT